MTLPRCFRFENYEIRDVKEYLTEGRIEIYLERDLSCPPICHRCSGPMGVRRGHHFLKIEAMPILGNRVYLHFARYKYHCTKCKKARSEKVPFLSELTPHMTEDYAWWVGRFCEIAAVSRVAELVSQDGMTTWRLDYNRMIQMMSYYRIPKIKKIAVDEVYARKKSKYQGESRDDRFFTVISDLETRKVIWVMSSRKKEALDGFFKLIGTEAAAAIELAAMDQYEGYKLSVQENCPNATIVWDKFHILQNFEMAVNETRKDLHEDIASAHPLKRITRGKYKYTFLKKAKNRTQQEQLHINDVLKENESFAKLEIIKERMLTFFDDVDEVIAKKTFEQIGDWIWQAGFTALMKWYTELERGWETLKNYFNHRVTSALAEGINNVIKALKRRAYGYRNMHYFRLKIMQVCGYLNSRFIKSKDQLLTQI